MPSARSVLASGLAGELTRFRKGGRQLRRILKETKHVHESIKKKGCYNKEQLEKFALKPEDETAVWNIIEQPVGFVVLGSCCWARAMVVNNLMGRNILPTVPLGETDTRWKMVRFSYGKETRAKIVLPNGFELLENLEFNNNNNNNQPSTIPLEDLQYKTNADSLEDPALTSGSLDLSLPHHLLYDNAQVVMISDRSNTSFFQEMKKLLEGITPVLIYAIGNTLSQQDIDDLVELQQLPYKMPIFFVCFRHPSQSDLTESGQHAKASSTSSSPTNSCPPSPTSPSAPPRTSSHAPYSRHPLEQLSLLRHCSEVQTVEHDPSSHMYSDIYLKLADLGFLADPGSKPEYKGSLEVSSELIEEIPHFTSILLFVSHVLQSRLLLAATLLQDTHARSLQNLILAAFDLSRDLAITPKRIRYARQREEALYRSLLDLAHNKQVEIRNMIVNTIREVKDDVLKKAANVRFQGAVLDECMKEPLTARTVHLCTCEIRDMVIDQVNNAVSIKLASSIEWLQEKFTGTLERCLLSLEQMYSDADESNKQASAALRHILSAAYQVEVSFRNSASIFWFLMQKMQQLAEVLPWKLPSAIDSQWKQEVAMRMLASLNESHLARSICHQLQQKVKSSHERFVASLTQLEERHLDRLEQRENERRNVRCLYAPQIAKLSLESSSLKDLIQYGVPPLGQELGRGHFGIVYSCKSWGGQNTLAVKSVALPTDKHWYSLAMEFYYHKNTPEHPRIVRLCGTVIDYKHDRRPTVLLIMERLSRDLYSALWNGLPWMQRLQVAVDVIQGIRYLHSQGLVHRDIKLHNVLLDKENRAKLSDLGFCKVEVMMSGSVVGTPIHMAPELLTGHYDNSVDIYAFGVLLWYLCSGQPRLPYVYEQCSHKEDLFALIKRGMRPERLPYFDEDCWELMSECWHGDPSKRPLPGEVERRLEDIIHKFANNKACVKSELSCNELTISHGSDCWSTYSSSRSYTVVSGSYAG